ncbi:hypothetical protein H8959_022230 [Pygathrix nigripes]
MDTPHQSDSTVPNVRQKLPYLPALKIVGKCHGKLNTRLCPPGSTGPLDLVDTENSFRLWGLGQT